MAHRLQFRQAITNLEWACPAARSVARRVYIGRTSSRLTHSRDTFISLGSVVVGQGGPRSYQARLRALPPPTQRFAFGEGLFGKCLRS
jgi:hypothetical protein